MNNVSDAPAASDEIVTELDGHVAIIRFNRPEAMNTITSKMLDQLSEHLLAADKNRDVRCIILTGTGRAFCAGLDVKSQAEGNGMLSGVGSGGASELDMRNTPPTVLHALDTPTIAALNGGAAGYGLDLALGCDIRIAARSAKLSMAFAKRGILPESGGTWLLPRIVGYAKAAELSFTGRTLSAEDAHGHGLVNHVVSDGDLMETTMAMAIEVAENAPLAVRAIKRMMRMGETETFEQNVHHVFLQLLPLLRTKDFQEGMMSYLERRPAQFEGR
jgi:enoyl-CoA hydratase/carnithine racemase